MWPWLRERHSEEASWLWGCLSILSLSLVLIAEIDVLKDRVQARQLASFLTFPIPGLCLGAIMFNIGALGGFSPLAPGHQCAHPTA